MNSADANDTPEDDGRELDQQHGSIVRRNSTIMEIWNNMESGGLVRLENGVRVELAHPYRRILATLFDGMVSLPLATISMLVVLVLPDAKTFSGVLILWCIAWFVYKTRMIARRGKTLGNERMGITIVQLASGAKPNRVAAAKRSIITLIPTATILAVLLVIVWIQRDAFDEFLQATSESIVGAVILIVGGVMVELLLNLVGWLVQCTFVRDRLLQGLHDKYARTIVINIGSGTVNIQTTHTE